MKTTTIQTATSLALISLLMIGCGEDPQNLDTPEEPKSTLSISYGLYGQNQDLGTSETIRLSWHRRAKSPSKLTLTTNLETQDDPLLESIYGARKYHFDIDKVTAPGIYNITCEPAIRTGTWTQYKCLRDGMFISQQDQSLDNGFVIETGNRSNRVFDSLIGTGTSSIGWLVHP